MNSPKIILFNFEGKAVRGVPINGEPWFIAKDICDLLGYSNSRRAIDMHCRGCNKMILPSGSGNQEYNIIPEPDVWRLIVKSTRPEAILIERWIMEDVLPSIRKTGSYSINNEEPEVLVAKALIAANQIIQNKDARIKELEPKAEFADHIAEAPRYYSFREAAKLLGFQDMGEKNLFAFARNQGLLMPSNEPYQQFVSSGLFKTVAQNFEKPNGEKAVNMKTVITGKGLDYLSRMLKSYGYQQVKEFRREEELLVV